LTYSLERRAFPISRQPASLRRPLFRPAGKISNRNPQNPINPENLRKTHLAVPKKMTEFATRSGFFVSINFTIRKYGEQGAKKQPELPDLLISLRKN
jgi:hypothetical protein